MPNTVLVRAINQVAPFGQSIFVGVRHEPIEFNGRSDTKDDAFVDGCNQLRKKRTSLL